MFKNKAIWRGFACLGAFIMLFGSTAGQILEVNRNMVNSYLGTQTERIEVTDSAEPLYTTFVSDYGSTEELVAVHEKLGEALNAEGTVLLKNNGALPLAKGSRVTMLGVAAEPAMNYGARVGVAVNAAQNIKLGDALERKGFVVNQKMRETYADVVKTKAFRKTNALQPNFMGVKVGEEKVYPAKEATPDELAQVDADSLNSIADYNNAAIVVIGRNGSEAADYFPGSTGIDLASGARNPLALTDEERDLLTYAKANFAHVIVLLNTANVMEVGELEKDTGIDAVLWMGFPGNYGNLGVAGILCGDVNPSGGLPDVYASNSVSSPAMQNYGVHTYANAAEYLDTAVHRADYYLIEAEGIYTGYRYYETRYADCVLEQGNAASTVGTFDSTEGWNYGEEVVYSFGYGLSYTTFEQTLDSVDVSVKDKTITAAVTVKNTGSVAGKTSVQLYGQAPYIAGGVEKSAIQLIDFAKTNVLQPGESCEMTIVADLQNISSYDVAIGKYILDGGNYTFAVGNGAHEALNNMLMLQGFGDKTDAQGNPACAKTWSYEPAEGRDVTTFSIGKGGVEVSNKLNGVDFNEYQPGTVTYLSRANWEATWPKTYTGLNLTENMLDTLTNDFYEIKTNEDVSGLVFGKNNGMNISEMKGADYDDPRWEKLLEQIPLQEAALFVTIGNMTYPDIPSIGFIGGTLADDAPNGFKDNLALSSDPSSPWYVSPEDPYAQYEVRDSGSPQLIGASFNKDLAEAIGTLLGNDSLFSGKCIIWGPGLNLHRTPYAGRNVEYYSEDPVLSGLLASGYAKGALSKGLIASGKHFAFNDQESNRNGVSPFMTEQKARELELRAFQIAFQNGMLGTMTAFNRIGSTYVSAHEGLIHGILCGEWGFRGYIVTDMINPPTYMTWKESVIAGTTNFDSVSIQDAWRTYLTEDSNTFSGDAKLLSRLKDAVHHTLYVLANSNYMNAVSISAKRVEINNWWRVSYRAVTYAGAGFLLAGLLGYVITLVRAKRKGGKKQA